MIIQKFYPVNILLEPLCNLCMQDHESYFKKQLDLDSRIVSKMILSSEETLLEILERLSLFTHEKDVNTYVQSLKQEHRFLLFVAIATTYVHFHADTELLPLIPDKNIYLLLFAYVQESYLSYKKHCDKNQLDIWYGLIDYVVDTYF